MQETGFYQKHLDRVSRSFAFCITKLESPFRQWTSLAYLLCRVLDTIEDSAWCELGLRDRQYAEFEAFLETPPSRGAVGDWAGRFPSSIPAGERDLLRDAYPLFEDLHSLPAGVRRAMHDTVGRMSVGMRHFAAREGDGAQVRLADLRDVNRYCYFVAGVVGEMLSRLYLEHRPQFRPAPGFFKNAFHFGLFLQKVNLLKDQPIDEREGRYLIPDRTGVLGSLREHAIHSVEYLSSLPPEEKGYRTFCAWSLFLGAASLPWIEKGAKIPRGLTQELLAAVETVSQDDAALRARLEEFLPFLPESPSRGARDRAEWFERIRGSALRTEELGEIGVI